MNKEMKRTIWIMAGFIATFSLMIVYLSYFQVFQAAEIKMHPQNKRLWINEDNVLRGSFYDRNDKLLVYSEKEGDKSKRHYSYGSLYSHMIGYSLKEYGKVGLELTYNNELLAISESQVLDDIKNLVLPTSQGNDIRLTVDHGLQEKARDLLQGYKGAIVALEPSTGEILAMVSLPDFNPSRLDEDWLSITEGEEAALLNRASQGLYPPGSTFKLVTALAAMESSSIDLNHTCQGKIKIGNYEFKDYKSVAHGSIGLTKALAQSCNTYFADKASQIGQDSMGETADKFYFNKEIPFDLPIKKSLYPYKQKMDEAALAASAIGQDKVLATPLNMAMIAASIANDGNMLKPILVKDVINKNGRIVKRNSSEIISNTMSSLLAEELTSMMREAVVSGSAKRASVNDVQVAGKTGTAENASGKSHSWFVGFAPHYDPKIAVAIIIEEAGVSGGELAAPMAGQLIDYAFSYIDF